MVTKKCRITFQTYLLELVHKKAQLETFAVCTFNRKPLLATTFKQKQKVHNHQKVHDHHRRIWRNWFGGALGGARGGAQPSEAPAFYSCSSSSGRKRPLEKGFNWTLAHVGSGPPWWYWWWLCFSSLPHLKFPVCSLIPLSSLRF